MALIKSLLIKRQNWDVGVLMPDPILFPFYATNSNPLAAERVPLI